MSAETAEIVRWVTVDSLLFAVTIVLLLRMDGKKR